jgi:two-component system, NarL family, invasion response regulator UvrY
MKVPCAFLTAHGVAASGNALLLIGNRSDFSGHVDMATLRFLISDDDALVRRAVRAILKTEFPDATYAEAGDGEAVLEQVRDSRWDLLVMDMNMPKKTGLQVLEEIKRHPVKPPILFLSVNPGEELAIRVFRAGASGYVSKEHSNQELLTAVKTILQGRKYVGPQLAEHLASRLQEEPRDTEGLNTKLSEREHTVLLALARGLKVKEIAGDLEISTKTVRTYRARLMDKLGLKSDAEIVRFALERNLIT